MGPGDAAAAAHAQAAGGDGSNVTCRLQARMEVWGAVGEEVVVWGRQG